MEKNCTARDAGSLILRVVAGGLLAGHGAQKLFGAFGGPGPDGMTGFMKSLGLEPAPVWAWMAGIGEFGGGVLTAAGFLHPLGPIGVMSVMGMAAGKVHAGKPIWVTEGGGEYPITNFAIALSSAVSGPGQYSVDRAVGIRVPLWASLTAGFLAAGAVAYGIVSAKGPPAQEAAPPNTPAHGAAQPNAAEQPAQ